MADLLSVKITADTTDLNAKLALAKAELAAFNSETRQLAQQARSAGDDIRGGLLTNLEQSAVRAAAAKSEVNSLRSALGEFGGASREAGAAAKEMHGSISVGTREFRALFDELSSGRARRSPGTIAIILNQVFGLGPAALAAVGGIAGLIGGLGYLTYRAMESAQALRDLSAAALFQNVDVSGGQLEKFTDQLSKVGDLSRDDSTEVVRAFLGMKNATAPLVQEMIDQLTPFIAATGDKAPEAAKKLAEAFGDPLSNGLKFLETMNASRQAIQKFDDAAQRGDVVGALTVMLETLAERTERVEKVTGASTAAQNDAVTALNALMGAEMGAAGAADQLSGALNKIDSGRVKKAAEDMAAALKAASAQAAAKPVGQPLDQVSLSIEQKKLEMEQSGATNAQILAMEADFWQKRAAVGDLAGKDLARVELSAGRARLSAAKATGEQLIEDAHNQIAQINADTLKGEVARQAQTVQVWQKMLGDQRLNAEQRKQVERDYNMAVASLRSEEAQDHMRQLQAQVAATRAGTAQRMAAIQAEVSFARAAYGQQSAAFIEADKQRLQEMRVEREQAAALEAKHTEDYIGELNKQLSAAIKHFQSLYKEHQVSIQDQIRIESVLTQAVYTEELRRLNALLQNDNMSLQERQRIEDQIVALKQRSTDAQVAINDRGNEEILSQDRKLQQELRQVFEPFSQFFDTTLSAMLDRSQNWSQQVQRAFAQLVSKLITEIAELALHWAAFQLATSANFPQLAGAIGNPFGANAGGLGGLIGSLFNSGSQNTANAALLQAGTALNFSAEQLTAAAGALQSAAAS